MTTNRLTLPLTAALGFAVTGLLQLLHEQAQPFSSLADHAIELAFLVGLAAAAAALLELRPGRALGRRRRRPGRARGVRRGDLRPRRRRARPAFPAGPARDHARPRRRDGAQRAAPRPGRPPGRLDPLLAAGSPLLLAAAWAPSRCRRAAARAAAAPA